MNKTWIWSLTVALAGFLFGFDTVVISGANAPIKELWQTSAWFHGVFIMSMALWGTVLGSLAGGIPTKRIGRKNTLIWVGVLYLVERRRDGVPVFSAHGQLDIHEAFLISNLALLGKFALGNKIDMNASK